MSGEGKACPENTGTPAAAAQSFGQFRNPQKLSGRSSLAPSIQPRLSDPMGWQETTCAVVSRPSLLRKRSRTPLSSFVRDRIAQPCAFTTSVSQTSEKCAAGSRLVTSIGIAVGTLELRRGTSERFLSCIQVCLCLSRIRSVPRDLPTITPS